MAFGLNRAELIGRLGADVTVNHLASGGRVATLSIATDEGYIDKNSGDRRDRTEWHRVVTFQDGLIAMLEKHARKGRLVYVAGKLQSRKWRKEGEDTDRYSTEILLPAGASSSSTSPTATARWSRRSRRWRPPTARPRGPLPPRRRTIPTTSRSNGSHLPPSTWAGASRVGPFLWLN